MLDHFFDGPLPVVRIMRTPRVHSHFYCSKYLVIGTEERGCCVKVNIGALITPVRSSDVQHTVWIPKQQNYLPQPLPPAAFPDRLCSAAMDPGRPGF